MAGGDVDVSTAAAHASCICRRRLQFVMTAELSTRLHAPNTQRGGDMAHTLAHYWIVHGWEGSHWCRNVALDDMAPSAWQALRPPT